MISSLLFLLLSVIPAFGYHFFDPYPGGTHGLPGVKFFLTNKGTDYFNMAASKSLNGRIKDLAHLGRMDRMLKLAVFGNSTAHIYDIQLLIFNNLTSQYHKLETVNRFRWEVSGGFALVRGNWRVSYQPDWSPKTIQTNGHFYAESVQGPQLSVSVQIEMEEGKTFKITNEGKTFKITNVQCLANIPDLSLCVYGAGSIGLIASFLNRFITDAIQTDLEKEICRLTTGFVEDVLNVKAKENPWKYFVKSTKLNIDYGLVRDPQMTEKGIELWMKGDTVHVDFPGRRAPFYPHPMPEPASFDKMLHVQLSDFNFNSVTYQLHNYGLDHFDSSKHNMTEELNTFLRLKCRRSELCLGSVRMDIAEKFPTGAKGELHVHPLSPAQVLYTENGALAKASAYFELFAVTPTEKSKIFGANGTAIGDLDFTIVDVSERKSQEVIHDPKLMAGLKIRRDEFTIEDSESEYMDDDGQVVDFVQFILPHAVEAIETLVNSTFNTGFVDVSLWGMKIYLKNPQIEIRNRTLQLSTDFVLD